MKNKYQRIAISILLVAALIFSMPGTAKAKGKVKLNKTRMSVTIGSTVELKVKNTTKKVTWSSNKKTVASVNSYGEVTGKKAGTAKITAKVGKKKLTCNVTVPAQYISNKSLYLQVGEKQTLNLNGVAGNDSVFWGSDYERIATVTQSGEITAKSIGTTSVYAVINSGVGKTYSCEVVVYGRSSSGDIIMATPRPVWTPAPTSSPSPTPRPTATPKPSYIAVKKVVLSQRSMSLAAGRTSRLTATVMPSDATNKSLRWTSANTNIATVKADGTVTGVSAGSTVVYVTTTDGEYIAICTVSVTGSISPSPSPSVRPSASPTPRPSVSPSPNPSASPTAVPVTKVSLSRKELSVKVGDSHSLTATVTPANAANKNIKWTSADTGIATVDGNGKVTAVAVGTTMVFVTTEDGEFVAVCRVTVRDNKPAEPTPTPFTLDKKSLELCEGQEATLTASGAAGGVDWTSSDTGVATVTNGKVAAVKGGIVEITAQEKEGEKRKVTCKVTVNSNVVAELETDKIDNTDDSKVKVTGAKEKEKITKVEIPDNVVEIAESAFKNAQKVWSVTLPKGITTIGAEAFSGCTSLESIVIPDSVTTIDAKAFSGCTSLQKIVISSNQTKIGVEAFAGCISLEVAKLPTGIIKNGNMADNVFADWKKLAIYGEENSDVHIWAVNTANIPFVKEENENEGEKPGT